MVRDGMLVFEDFADLVGAEFSVRVGGGIDRTLALIEATALAAHAAAPVPRPPFVLTFRDASDDVLPQGLYAFTHDRLGTVEIFIGPVAKTAAGVDYSATFN